MTQIRNNKVEWPHSTARLNEKGIGDDSWEHLRQAATSTAQGLCEVTEISKLNGHTKFGRFHKKDYYFK